MVTELIGFNSGGEVLRISNHRLCVETRIGVENVHGLVKYGLFLKWNKKSRFSEKTK